MVVKNKNWLKRTPSKAISNVIHDYIGIISIISSNVLEQLRTHCFPNLKLPIMYLARKYLAKTFQGHMHSAIYPKTQPLH